MLNFEFDNGFAFIDENVVHYIDNDDIERVFSGFPNDAEALEFVLFGDFSPPETNDFIGVTNKDYKISALIKPPSLNQ